MSFTDFLAKNWAVFISDSMYAAFLLVGFVTGAGIVWQLNKSGDRSHKAEIDSLRERLNLRDDQLNSTRQERDAFLERLELLGADVEAIRAELATRPKIIASSEAPPDNLEDGTIWLRYDDKKEKVG